MKNFGNDSVKGKIKVDAPVGWSGRHNELEYELSGTEEKNLPIKAIPSKESSGSSQFTITALRGRPNNWLQEYKYIRQHDAWRKF
ncbi:hypothetical protein KEH51_23605 [[Brevibacterium] frigoritolerans]|uniref:Uncharacterized protein n=1 Tax=Peribacillus frigoritolerans TaxID=450367 RepID=A0A941J6A2_9BACI|nr:hypothetical protein [Peribacillus frigoritolerans]